MAAKLLHFPENKENIGNNRVSLNETLKTGTTLARSSFVHEAFLRGGFERKLLTLKVL